MEEDIRKTILFTLPTVIKKNKNFKGTADRFGSMCSEEIKNSLSHIKKDIGKQRRLFYPHIFLKN